MFMKKEILALICLLFALNFVSAIQPCHDWVIRGDANGDGVIDLSDPVYILRFLFSGGTEPCLEAADFDKNGQIELTDAVRLLGYLFRGESGPGNGDGNNDLFFDGINDPPELGLLYEETGSIKSLITENEIPYIKDVIIPRRFSITDIYNEKDVVHCEITAYRILPDGENLDGNVIAILDTNWQGENFEGNNLLESPIEFDLYEPIIFPGNYEIKVKCSDGAQNGEIIFRVDITESQGPPPTPPAGEQEKQGRNGSP